MKPSRGELRRIYTEETLQELSEEETDLAEIVYLLTEIKGRCPTKEDFLKVIDKCKSPVSDELRTYYLNQYDEESK